MTNRLSLRGALGAERGALTSRQKASAPTRLSSCPQRCTSSPARSTTVPRAAFLWPWRTVRVPGQAHGAVVLPGVSCDCDSHLTSPAAGHPPPSRAHAGGQRSPGNCSLQLRVGYRDDAPGAPAARPAMVRQSAPAAGGAAGGGGGGGLDADALPVSLTLQNGWDVGVDLGAVPGGVAYEVVVLDGGAAPSWRRVYALTSPPAADCAALAPTPVLQPPPGVYLGAVAVNASVATIGNRKRGTAALSVALSGATAADAAPYAGPVVLAACGTTTVTATSVGGDGSGGSGLVFPSSSSGAYTITVDPTNSVRCLWTRPLPPGSNGGSTAAGAPAAATALTVRMRVYRGARDAAACDVLLRLRYDDPAAREPAGSFRLVAVDAATGVPLPPGGSGGGGGLDVTLTLPNGYYTLVSVPAALLPPAASPVGLQLYARNTSSTGGNGSGSGGVTQPMPNSDLTRRLLTTSPADNTTTTVTVTASASQSAAPLASLLPVAAASPSAAPPAAAPALWPQWVPVPGATVDVPSACLAFAEPPTFDPEPAAVPAGVAAVAVRVTAGGDGGGTVFLTTDGSNPKTAPASLAWAAGAATLRLSLAGCVTITAYATRAGGSAAQQAVLLPSLLVRRTYCLSPAAAPAVGIGTADGASLPSLLPRGACDGPQVVVCFPDCSPTYVLCAPADNSTSPLRTAPPGLLCAGGALVAAAPTCSLSRCFETGPLGAAGVPCAAPVLPSPSSTPTPTSTMTPTQSATGSASRSPSGSSSSGASPSRSASRSLTGSRSATASASRSASATASCTASASVSPSGTASSTASASTTPTGSRSGSASASASATPSPSESADPNPHPLLSPSATATGLGEDALAPAAAAVRYLRRWGRQAAAVVEAAATSSNTTSATTAAESPSPSTTVTPSLQPYASAASSPSPSSTPLPEWATPSPPPAATADASPPPSASPSPSVSLSPPPSPSAAAPGYEPVTQSCLLVDDGLYCGAGPEEARNRTLTALAGGRVSPCFGAFQRCVAGVGGPLEATPPGTRCYRGSLLHELDPVCTGGDAYGDRDGGPPLSPPTPDCAGLAGVALRCWVAAAPGGASGSGRCGAAYSVCRHGVGGGPVPVPDGLACFDGGGAGAAYAPPTQLPAWSTRASGGGATAADAAATTTTGGVLVAADDAQCAAVDQTCDGAGGSDAPMRCYSSGGGGGGGGGRCADRYYACAHGAPLRLRAVPPGTACVNDSLVESTHAACAAAGATSAAAGGATVTAQLRVAGASPVELAAPVVRGQLRAAVAGALAVAGVTADSVTIAGVVDAVPATLAAAVVVTDAGASTVSGGGRRRLSHVPAPGVPVLPPGAPALAPFLAAGASLVNVSVAVPPGVNASTVAAALAAATAPGGPLSQLLLPTAGAATGAGGGLSAGTRAVVTAATAPVVVLPPPVGSPASDGSGGGGAVPMPAVIVAAAVGGAVVLAAAVALAVLAAVRRHRTKVAASRLAGWRRHEAALSRSPVAAARVSGGGGSGGSGGPSPGHARGRSAPKSVLRPASFVTGGGTWDLAVAAAAGAPSDDDGSGEPHHGGGHAHGRSNGSATSGGGGGGSRRRMRHKSVTFDVSPPGAQQPADALPSPVLPPAGGGARHRSWESSFVTPPAAAQAHRPPQQRRPHSATALAARPPVVTPNPMAPQQHRPPSVDVDAGDFGCPSPPAQVRLALRSGGDGGGAEAMMVVVAAGASRVSGGSGGGGGGGGATPRARTPTSAASLATPATTTAAGALTVSPPFRRLPREGDGGSGGGADGGLVAAAEARARRDTIGSGFTCFSPAPSSVAAAAEAREQ